MKIKKKLAAAAAAGVLLSAGCLPAGAQGTYVEKLIGGDVNGDGLVLSDDALLILRHSLDMFKIAGLYEDMADVDNSGTVDSTDALMVLRCSVAFPAEEGSIIGKEFSSSVVITDLGDIFGG